MMRNNVSTGNGTPQKSSRLKRFVRAFLGVLDSVLSRGTPRFKDPPVPEKLRRKMQPLLRDAELTESQRQQIAEEQRRRTRFR
jgi:hypothetical protein